MYISVPTGAATALFPAWPVRSSDTSFGFPLGYYFKKKKWQIF